MAKTVLIVEATGLVDNVIKLAAGTPYDPAPGLMMLSVADDTRVGPGMRWIENSAPPAFEDVPVEEQEQPPATQTEALDKAEAALREALAAVEAARAIG